VDGTQADSALDASAAAVKFDDLVDSEQATRAHVTATNSAGTLHHFTGDRWVDSPWRLPNFTTRHWNLP
jgi:hypothetical protein